MIAYYQASINEQADCLLVCRLMQKKNIMLLQIIKSC